MAAACSDVGCGGWASSPAVELDEEELDEEEAAAAAEPEEVPVFLGRAGRVYLFRSPEGLVDFVKSGAVHDLSQLDTWSELAGKLSADDVVPLPDDTYELDLVVDNLRGSRETWDANLLIQAGEVARDLGYALRIEPVIAHDPTNGSALASGAKALAVLGESDRAREWMQRALLLDPDNLNMRYNVACTLLRPMGEIDEALDTLDPFFAKVTSTTWIWHAEADPDLEEIHDNPRFKTMLEAAKQRLGMAA